MWLVTGATGHIGNVLVRKLLESGQRVRALVWRGEDTTLLEGLDVEKVEGDVLDLSSLWEPFRGVRGVFHLAGVISILPGADPHVWRVNVEGAQNVLRAAITAQGCIARAHSLRVITEKWRRVGPTPPRAAIFRAFPGTLRCNTNKKRSTQ